MSKNYNCMLAHTYDERKHNPIGYWMSEKYDGRRVKWKGTYFEPRNDNQLTRTTPIIRPPAWWCKDMPTTFVPDGELWMGRGKFQKLNGFLNKHNQDDETWSRIGFMCYDVDDTSRDWIDRFTFEPKHPLVPAPHYLCHSIEEFVAFYNSVVDNGGEGIMLRSSKCPYVYGRSWDLLKVKPELYAQGKVVGYTEGEGKYVGMVGAVEVDVDRVSKNEKHWDNLDKPIRAIAGSGLTDADRTEKYKPALGSRVQLMFTSFTDDGNLRFPRFDCRIEG